MMLDTLDLFHKGAHELEAEFTPELLTVLITRADQHLLFLLGVASRANSRN
jgi:hypothetical protein